MSAVAALICGDAIYIAGDGAVCNERGELIGETRKIFYSQNSETVIAHVGLGGVGRYLLPHIEGCSSFDEVCERVSDFLRVNVRIAMSVRRMWSDDVRSTVLIGGWSKARERFELYTVHSSGKEAIGASGQIIQREPWTLHYLDQGFWVSSNPREEDQRDAGLLDPQPIQALDYVARWVAACRLWCAQSRGYGVGCFLQTAIVHPKGFVDWIAHRWPDPLGQPIDPTQGDLLPDSPISLPGRE